MELVYVKNDPDWQRKKREAKRKPRYCTRCDIEIKDRAPNAKYCLKCAKEVSRYGFDPSKRYRAGFASDPLKGKSIAEVDRLAAKRNMTYGQYEKACRDAGRLL